MATKILGWRAGRGRERDDSAGPQPGESFAGPHPWQAAGPLGGEVRVNGFTTGAQANPAIAILSTGAFVVAWTSTGQDGSGDGVYAQRFAADGTPVGAEFRIATTTADDQRTPSLAALSDGGFVATWQGRVSGADGFDIYGQRYNAAGTPQGDQFMINTTTASFQGSSSVAGFPGGGFIVTWHSLGSNETADIYARRYNADGSPAAAEFRINSFITGNQDEAAVAVLTGGGIVVTWQSENQDGSSRGVYGQLYNAAGAPVGTEFKANTTTANAQQMPAVAALEGGGFVIVWSGNATRAQIYAADGTPVGGEIPIAAGFNGVSVTAMQGGGFAVSWDEIASGGAGDGNGFAVVARAFNASGGALGEIVVVNETTAGDQRTGGPGSLGQLSDGSIAFVWAGNGTGDSSGVFLRRHVLGDEASGPAPIVGTPGDDTLSGTTGDDVLRGLGGNDEINGLGGEDLADYRGARSDYRVTLRNGVYTIDDQREGSPDGTDTLRNVELLRFDDGETVAIGDAVAPTLTPGATPLTGAVLINATPEPSAIFPMTVALSGGGYAVVWLGDFAVQGNPATLRGRAFNAAGQPVGNEFTVGDMDFLSEEQVPSLTALAGGGFAVTWMSPSADIFDQYQDLQVQIYDATGGAGPRINAGSTGRFSTPVLVGAADGGFLLIRDPENGTDEFSTTGQFFDAAGTAIGSAFPVAANVGDHVSAAILANGDIVMAWNEPPQSGGERAYVRLFSPAGQPRGEAFVVDLAQLPGQNVPSVAALAGGGFVMTWFHSNPDTDVYARVFNAAGNPVTATFTVNENTAGTQWYGFVEALDDGGFVVSWTGRDGDLDGVFGRVFDASGQPRGGEFMINPEIAGNQEGEIRHLAQLADGDLIFSWTGDGGDSSGVFTRRYSVGGGSGAVTGTTGPDLLDGRDDGAPTVLTGLGGDDTFFVDSAGDQVVEGAGGGTDVVYSQVSYTLGAGQEVEVLSLFDRGGTAGLNLTGNGLAQTLIGGAGANVLNGGGGTDVLYGLGGNDTYVVDSMDDQVIEYARQGNDTVFATSSYTLTAGQEIEVLDSLDRGGTGAFTLTGNAFGQTIIGNAGDNVLNGGGGADILYGLGGNDTYILDGGDDVVIEAAGGGTDVVYAMASYALAVGTETEVLSAFQTDTGAVTLTGNATAQTIIGNAGNNVLDGGGGDDVLYGLGGNDTFAFTSALGANNVDLVVGFVSGAGKIALDDAIFAGIGPLGAFNPNTFVTGAAAQDGDDRIIYNNATGQLFYDADGSGAGAAVLFAALNGAPGLAASDFTVI